MTTIRRLTTLIEASRVAALERMRRPGPSRAEPASDREELLSRR